MEACQFLSLSYINEYLSGELVNLQFVAAISRDVYNIVVVARKPDLGTCFEGLNVLGPMISDSDITLCRVLSLTVVLVIVHTIWIKLYLKRFPQH